MLRSSLLPAAAAAILVAAASSALADPVKPATAQPAAPALTGSSMGAVLHAKFTWNGKKTDYGYELPIIGTAPPAYNHQTIKSSYAKTSKFDDLTFIRSATSVQSEATGHAATATGIITTGSATIGAFSGKLTSPIGTLMTVTTGKISAEARYIRTVAGVPSVKGSTSLLNVHIDAPVFGFSKTYSGTPKPNEVLYHNKDNTIVVYLNRQVTTTVNGKPTSIKVAAVDVQIYNYRFADQTVSATIMVAPTEAQ